MEIAEGAARRAYFLVEEAPREARPEARAEVAAKRTLTLAMWGSSVALFTLATILSPIKAPLAAFEGRLLLALFGMLLCYGLHRLLRALAHRPFRVRAIVASLTAPLIAEVYAWVSYFALAYLRGRPARFVILDWNDAVVTLALWTWFFVAWTGLYLAIEYSFEARHEARRAAELRDMAQAAKLSALSNQINPHFLFNSLNSISALILDGRSDDAERMLAQLATFFRSTLAVDPLVDVPLAQELELHRRYLAIEQMRYPDLTVDIALPDALRSAAVPALIVQPLVENAVKHGVAHSRPPTRIEIAAARVGDSLEIRVTDHGNPEVERRVPAGQGIGLANVRQRLAAYFGAAQRLDLAAGPGWFEARVTMPLAQLP